MKYRAMVEGQVSIYKNCIVNKGDTTLFYAINLYNFLIYTDESKSRHIDALYNLILNIENIFGTVNFSLFRFEDIVSPNEYIDSFLSTVRLWDPDAQPSEEFIQSIHYTSQYYCILAVDVNDKKNIDFNTMGVKEIVKEYAGAFVDLFAKNKQQDIDKERIESLSTRIANAGQGMIKPCPEDVVLAFYIKKVFPHYNIMIKPEDMESKKSILAYLQQDLTPYFNYFTMSNAGVELFGLEAHETYGSVIDIVEFPEEIISESFSVGFDNMVVNCKTLTKQEAKVKFSRKKQDIDFEEESADTAGSTNYNLELADYKDMVDLAIAAASMGRKIVEADIHILVTAEDLETLNKRRYRVISALKNLNIVATFAADQAKEYVDSFVRMRPSKYPFIMDLRYPLSFRLTDGSNVGDFDSKYTSPVLGRTASYSEATE